MKLVFIVVLYSMFGLHQQSLIATIREFYFLLIEAGCLLQWQRLSCELESYQ